MSTTKAIREARQRVAAIEAKQRELQRRITELAKQRAPLEARISAIGKRRERVGVIKFLAGNFILGTLATLRADIAYVKDLKPTPKPIRDGLESGGIKISAGGYGQSYSLKGLLPRLRLIDRPTLAVYRRKVKARERAEEALRKARAAEAEAFRATYDAGAKPDRELVIKGIVDEAIAQIQLQALPYPATIEHEIERLTRWDDSPLKVAQQHLEHAKSGSTEPCPCETCRADAARAEQLMAIKAHRATLPRRMVVCPVHKDAGRKRMPWEVVTRRLTEDEFSRLGLAEYGMKWSYYDNSFALPVAYCPSGDLAVVYDELRAAKAKADKAAAKKAAKAAKGRIWTNPSVAQEGDTVEFTCPVCNTQATSDVYPDEDGELRVGCGDCEAELLVANVSLRKAA